VSNPLIFMAGPCVIETPEITLLIAEKLQAITSALGVEFYFKASYDKANRTSASAYRGPGLRDGLRILAYIKEKLGVRIVTDVHSVDQVKPVADVVDIIQIPAFLCRQTDLLLEAGRTGRRVNIKKAQFMAPLDMQYAVQKVESTGNKDILVTERGATFGYNNLVVDFRSFSIMKTFGYPVVFDATHSVQIPSQGGKSSGNREYAIPLARAAAAYGIDGLFCEVHPEPDKAMSDAANTLHLHDVEGLLTSVMAIRQSAFPPHAGGPRGV